MERALRSPRAQRAAQRAEAMNWESVGAIAELIGEIGVIVTLAYVAVQIAQNNRNLQESTSAAFNQGWASINSRLSSDEEFA
jgi:hypothetical protein